MSSLCCGSVSASESSPHSFIHCSLGLAWEHLNWGLYLKGQKNSQHIIPLDKRVRILILKSLWATVRLMGVFFFLSPVHTSQRITWFIYWYLNWPFFFLPHMQISICLAFCGNNQSHVTQCPLTLEARKGHDSKYVLICRLWGPLRDSYLLHGPFLICSLP